MFHDHRRIPRITPPPATKRETTTSSEVSMLIRRLLNYSEEPRAICSACSKYLRSSRLWASVRLVLAMVL